MSAETQTVPQHAEIVVIGSGPGGATTAHLLAERGRNVVILEEGPNLPLGSSRPFGMEEMAQKYRAGGLNPTLGNVKVTFVEGRTVGGGSEINSGLYHRTPPQILEQWRDQYQVRESLEADLLPHFEYCEAALQVQKYPGAIPVSSVKLMDGAERLGWRVMEVPRWIEYDGSLAPDGSPRGTSQTMTKTFVPRAVKAGATLLAETRVNRLQRSGSGWTVHATRHGQSFEIKAETVFVCGGAVQTPLLLMRSGITKNIGKTLAIHPMVKVVAMFDEEVNHEHLGIGVHQVKEFAPHMSFGCSVSSLAYLELSLADYAGMDSEIQAKWRHMAVYYAQVLGSNNGSVQPVFNLPDPLIRYPFSGQDLRDLATAMRRLSTMLLYGGARRVYPSLVGARPIANEGELSTIPSQLTPGRANVMTIHLFSSCPMGENQDRCAVDSMGRVHGFTGLYINDASIFPTAPSVNPQGTVMALARRNTLKFLGEI